MSKFLKFLWITLALAVLAFGIAVFASWYSNGYESVSGLYLKNEGKIIKSGTALDFTDKISIKVKSAGFTDRSKGYKVTVTPNPQADFTYTVNGEEYKFSSITDLTPMFEIEQEGSGFILSVPEKCTLMTLLEDYHGGAKVQINQELSTAKYYLVLTVTSTDGFYDSSLNFNVKFGGAIAINPDGVELDPDHIDY